MRLPSVFPKCFYCYSHFVVSNRVALPEGITRDRVKLTINPDNSLRVTVSDGAAVADVEGGGRAFYKDVRLPRDALFSEISAKFETEQETKELNDDSTSKEEGRDGIKGGAEEDVVTSNNSIGGTLVSGLEVTVGRVVPPQPKRIDIM